MNNFQNIIKSSPLPTIIHDRFLVHHVSDEFSRLTKTSDDTSFDFKNWLATSLQKSDNQLQLIDAIDNKNSCEKTIHGIIRGNKFSWKVRSVPLLQDQGNDSLQVTWFMDTSLEETKKAYWDLHLNMNMASMNLQKANTTLKETQAQLMQSEKLASIGHLAAGVAHEINNPLGFVKSNLDILEDYLKEYLSLFNIINSLKDSHLDTEGQNKDAIIDKYFKAAEEKNLSFISDDIKQLMQQTSNGINRIRKIVLDLRSFSREGDSEIESCNIEELIESILNIVNNELKYKAEIIKEFDAIPRITCNAHSIGQVFLNILVNAAQAIESKGTIKIKTYHDQSYIYIEISDTGVGIPEEHLNKIFNPFYTTKDVGKGTGLGLSICFETIKKHKGKLEVESKAGKGTKFKIALPKT